MRQLIARRRSASLAAVVLVAALTSVCGQGSPRAVVSGEVIETFCWARLRVGCASHAACGIECAKRGIPVGLFDARSGELFILLPGRDNTAVPPGLIAAMGTQVSVRGEIVRRAGASFLTVQSWERVR